jgi:hypothetical protein
VSSPDRSAIRRGGVTGADFISRGVYSAPVRIVMILFPGRGREGPYQRPDFRPRPPFPPFPVPSLPANRLAGGEGGELRFWTRTYPFDFPSREGLDNTGIII